MMKSFDFQKMPIVDVLNEILVDSSKRGASDIHFDPFTDYLLVRIRIDGILHDYTKIPKEVKDYLITRIKTISRMNITESRIPQDGAIKTTLDGIDLDLRVSALPVNGGEKVVIRILDYTRSMAGLEELSFSEKNFKKLLEMISVPNGIILVTGATGSGKSTTVYSILQHLNKSETNIITVEDPIEMDISGINQVQTNSKVGLTFASALRSILRQDPDIIMIGEIRDTETAKIAVRASITGHLVLSTLHTNTALNTIERLIDMDVQKYLLSSALEGVISQKLARRLCSNCKKQRPTTNYEKEIFKTVLGKEIDEIWETVGCEKCHGGYIGRIPIHEVLKISQRIRDALGENLPKDKFRNLVYGHGDVITMLQDGLEKVVEGHTTFEEILKLIELEDDDQISENSALKEAILETKAAMETEDNKENTDSNQIKKSQDNNYLKKQDNQDSKNIQNNNFDSKEENKQIADKTANTYITDKQLQETQGYYTNKQIETPQSYIQTEQTQIPQSYIQTEQAQIPQSYAQTEQAQAPQSYIQTEQAQIPQSYVQTEQAQPPQSYIQTEQAQTPQSYVQTEQTQMPQSYIQTEQVQIPQSYVQTEQAQIPHSYVQTEQTQMPQSYIQTEQVQIPQSYVQTEQAQIPQSYIQTEQAQIPQSYIQTGQNQIPQNY